MNKASFASGCFWCSEAVFKNLKGVENLVSGFMGGDVKNPAYREVITGRTGHAETIQFDFDPEIIGYDELLSVFFSTHDPTTLNRQGNDIGTQYRSVIFYHSESQKETALKTIENLNQEIFDGKIVTEVVSATEFYSAEDYHQDYYKNNPDNPYCQVTISPKLQKLRKSFADKLKN
jgi:peptide-methionine (S)-S-oxide reductase